ncbi:MAG: hypothetical protein AAF696_10870 [Bacteroidota bacterium]
MDKIMYFVSGAVVLALLFKTGPSKGCACEVKHHPGEHQAVYDAPRFQISREDLRKVPTLYMIDRGSQINEKRLPLPPPDTLNTYPGKAATIPTTGAFEEIQKLRRTEQTFKPKLKAW